MSGYEENYFDAYSEEELLSLDIDSKEDFPDYFFTWGGFRKISEEEMKEQRLELKRDYYRKLLQLGLIDYTPDLDEKLGYGHYRENKGYNKYNEWCCNKCKQYKPRTIEFYPKDRKRKDGLGYTCRECLKAYSKNYYQKKLERKAEEKKREKEEF